MASEPLIEYGSGVTLYFSVGLPDGAVIDSNFDGQPASFRLGDGNMLPGFERHLLGLCAGDEVQVTVPSSEAFGAVNDANVHRIDRERFRLFLADEFESLRAGDVVAFKDAGGFDLPGVIKEISASAALVDFNHPLAGRDILFRARIVSVLPTEARAVDIKY